MTDLKTAHLFAGAGGGILADLILGHKPLLAIEQEESCCRSLLARSREGWLPGIHVHCGNIRKVDFAPWAGGVDCITAGFPCQDISCAGQGQGIKGNRSGLVWEVFRAVDVIRPGLVFLENSPRIRTRGRREIIAALVERGYTWRDGTLAAAAVGAPHIRDRWWLLAANADGHIKLEQERHEREKRGWLGDSLAEAAIPADMLRQRLQVSIQCGGLRPAEAEAIEAAARYTGAYHWSPPDAGICGMVDGLAVPMDGCSKRARIKACGNGQVPLAAAAAWLMLST